MRTRAEGPGRGASAEESTHPGDVFGSDLQELDPDLEGPIQSLGDVDDTPGRLHDVVFDGEAKAVATAQAQRFGGLRAEPELVQVQGHGEGRPSVVGRLAQLVMDHQGSSFDPRGATAVLWKHVGSWVRAKRRWTETRCPFGVAGESA